MLLNPFTIHFPKSLKEASKLNSELDRVRFQAGGTFLLNSLKVLKKRGLKTPDHIINLGKILELQGFSIDKDVIKINAMAVISDLQNDVSFLEALPIFKIIFKDLATTQIRNMATIGGNLTCRYTWTELPAVLIGFQANMIFLNQDGERTEISAEDFYKSGAKTKDIFIQAHIKNPHNISRSYMRMKKSPHVDIPLFSILISSDIQKGTFKNTIVSINNCVDFAQRDNALEEFLNEKSCDEKTIAESLKHMTESIYEKRGSDYKRHMFNVYLKKCLTNLIHQGAEKTDKDVS